MMTEKAGFTLELANAFKVLSVIGSRGGVTLPLLGNNPAPIMYWVVFFTTQYLLVICYLEKQL